MKKSKYILVYIVAPIVALVMAILAVIFAIIALCTESEPSKVSLVNNIYIQDKDTVIRDTVIFSVLPTSKPTRRKRPGKRSNCDTVYKYINNCDTINKIKQTRIE